MKRDNWTVLHDRGVIAFTGKDARLFLQGLITNDVENVASPRLIYGAILTPQGKLLYDFFIAENNDTLLMDCNSTVIFDLIRRFNLYKLRADVNIEDRSHDFLVLSSLQTQVNVGDSISLFDDIASVDTRCSKLGRRAIVPAKMTERIFECTSVRKPDQDLYQSTRIRAGIPDCAVDCVPGDLFALECCLDDFNGISFEKGCFVGQEVTTRMKHRKLVRKKFLPISFEGAAMPLGTPIVNGDAKVGEVRSCIDGHAIAMLRLDHAESETLLAANLPISVKNTNL